MPSKDKLYHTGIRGRVSRSTLADANERRDWRIYGDLAQALIRIASPLYADEELGFDLDNTVYALDASMIDLCLSARLDSREENDWFRLFSQWVRFKTVYLPDP